MPRLSQRVRRPRWARCGAVTLSLLCGLVGAVSGHRHRHVRYAECILHTCPRVRTLVLVLCYKSIKHDQLHLTTWRRLAQLGALN